MMNNDIEWLPLDVAATHFGYSHPESLRQRIRQLRIQGEVVDQGNPPSTYTTTNRARSGSLVIFWPNPKTALICSDASTDLLNPRRGKRKKTASKLSDKF